MKKFLLVIIFLIISVSYNTAQNNSYAIATAKLKAEIFDKAKSIIGDTSQVMSVVNVGKPETMWQSTDDFQNPHGLLDGCALFSCGPEPDPDGMETTASGNYWVGVYKDNEVIWISEPVYKEAVWGEFEYTQDLNKDGNVELIHTWKIYDMYGPILTTYLHVISWDGQKGVFVNDGGMNTRIEEDRAIIDIADLNKDGISEIIAISEEYNEISGEWKKWKTVFCWNGTLYGKWADCPEWPDPTRDPYYPLTAANDFKIEINSKVRRYEDRFEYSMHVKNLAESNQGIRQFFYYHYADSLSWLRPASWGGTIALDGKLVGVTALEDSQIINPGNEEYFAHKSPGLPKIADGYFLSAYQELDLSLILDNFWYYRDKNIINNSVNVKMLSPANPPDPLIPSEFLDTLITYADSSYSLGWIKDEQTKSKYENYFAYAKEKLANGDRAFAKSYLQKVLTDVDVDSTSLLSSEAYALLRYNTEYLLKQIEQ